MHDFEFGSIPPEIEIKDICDPLGDFYELNDDDSSGEEDGEGESEESVRDMRRGERGVRAGGMGDGGLSGRNPPPYIDTRAHGLGLRSMQSPEMSSPFLGVSTSTPGIPGGTSNLNYFHSQLATGLSGTQTPLAAVAGAHLPNGWPDYTSLPSATNRVHRRTESGSSITPPQTADAAQLLRERASVSTLATSATPTTRPQTRDGNLSETEEEEPTSPPKRFREPRVEDLQTVFRVKYSGDVKLSLTAEILLDYPMPSFVGIPVKLNITGLSFDGVAVLAYIRKRAHFCFLSPEDAGAYGEESPFRSGEEGVGPREAGEEVGNGEERRGRDRMKIGGLLHEIKVESEIGKRENGKQVLKNVGKVEKFVLEQVRRIFEDEFVYPSFWTFLV